MIFDDVDDFKANFSEAELALLKLVHFNGTTLKRVNPTHPVTITQEQLFGLLMAVAVLGKTNKRLHEERDHYRTHAFEKGHGGSGQK